MTFRPFKKEEALAGVFKASILSFIAIMAFGLYDFILPIFTESASGSFAIVGAIVSLVYVASLLSEIPVGRAVDRFGRIRVLILSVAFMGILGIFYFFVKDVIYLAILSLIIGVAAVAFWIPSAVLVREFSPRRMLSESQGVYLSISQLGWVVGPAIAGIISITFAERHNFLLFSFFMFVTAAVAIGLFRGEKARRFRSIEKGRRHMPRLTFIFTSLKKYAKLHKHALPIYVLSFIAYVWIAIEWAFVALAGMDRFGYNAQLAGFLLSAMMAIEGLLYFSSGRLMDKIGCKYILTIGFFILFSSSYFMFLATTPAVFVLATLLAAGATSWILPGTEALLTKITPVNMLGEITSVFDTSKDLGLIAGPFIGGLLATLLANAQASFILVMLTAGAGCIISAYVFWPEKLYRTKLKKKIWF